MTPMRPKLARLAASTGNVGRIPANVSLATSVVPGTVCSVDLSCGSALATSVVNRASPSAIERMSSPLRSCASRNGPAWSISDEVWSKLALASSTSSRADWISRASSGPEPLNALNVSSNRSCSRVSPTLLISASASCSMP